MQQMPRNLRIIGNVTLVLIIVSALVIITMGLWILSTAREIVILNKYLDNAVEVRPNFENSMIMYTTRTGKIVGSLMKLRPENEEDYVAFISAVEDVGKRLAIDLDIKSYKEAVVETKDAKAGNSGSTLSYMLSFYGTDADTLTLISALQELPYFVRIESMTFNNLDHLNGDEKKLPNVSMVIKLYVK